MQRRGRPRPQAPELQLLGPAEGAWVAGMLEATAGRMRGLGLVPGETADFRGDPDRPEAPDRTVRTVHARGTTTWGRVAEEHGTQLHAAAQWAGLAPADGVGSSASRRHPRLAYGAPSEGTLGQPDPGHLAEVLLVAHDGRRLRCPEWPRAVHPAFPAWEGAEYQSPQPAWPRDRAWSLASEIDLDSTLGAGSATMVREFCSHPGLEAVVVRPDTDLTAFADTVNHREPSS